MTLALSCLAIFGTDSASAASTQPMEACTPSEDSGNGLLITLLTIGGVVVLVGGFLLFLQKQVKSQQHGVELKTCGGCNASDQVGAYCGTCGATLLPDSGTPNVQPSDSRAPRAPSAHQ
jgi:hypothetical protein